MQLAELLDSVLEMYEPKARSKSIRVQRTFGWAVAIQAVEGGVRQVISNLVANSIDALPPKGTLSVWNRRSVSSVGEPAEGPAHHRR